MSNLATDSKVPDAHDLPGIAREKVETGSVPTWVDPCYCDRTFTPKIRGTITYLLIERQIHAELGQTFYRTAMRLESQHAVQKHSQWRLEFEPQTQSIVLHSIKIRRGDIETEHLSLEKIQFLQRESGLEGCVIHGWITLLLLLEDVCPGDILEWSYTITTRPRLMPEYVSSFFTLPAGAEIGRYNFVVLHADSRAMKWKSSSPKLTPKITSENGEVCWSWMDVRVTSTEPENCTPAGTIDFPWIQISDCRDWQTVVNAFLNAWMAEKPGDCLSRLVQDVSGFSPDLLPRVNRAIELVQDTFRYLVVDLELGGCIPSQPEDVARRRYGDCKNLAFLLVHLLRALGVTARPVLVNSSLRGSVSTMLPAPGIFNHCIVEFEIENEKRWVDATFKSQGGGALHKSVQNFGVGLPIDANVCELAPVPKASLPSGTFDVKESFILDTAGNSSYFAVLITATGIHADHLRFEFANESIEALAKKRLQACANRFTRATRIGSLQYRDNRELNEFVVSEAFEISEVVKIDKARNSCLFSARSDVIASALIRPGVAARRNPFVLPFPCKRTHIIEIDFPGLDKMPLPIVQIGSHYFSFSRRSRAGPRFLTITFSLETLADSVPPDKTPEHRKQVDTVWQAASILLRLPLGYFKPQKRPDFGSLPQPIRGATSFSVRPIPAASAGMPPASTPTQTPAFAVAELPLDTESSNPQTPTAKQMPPARAPVVAAPAKHRSTRPHRQLRGGYQNISRGMLSFALFGAAVVAFVFSGFLVQTAETRSIGGLLGLVAFPSFLGSLLLAAVALKDCLKYRDRNRRGKAPALATLTGGGTLILCFAIAIINHRSGPVRAAADARPIENDQNVIRFSYLNFVFHPPNDPWRQVDPRRFNQSGVLAFATKEPMVFTLNVTRLDTNHLVVDPLKQITELTKKNLRRISASYNLLNEGEKARNNLAGWETEARIASKGDGEIYMVNWLLATNGFGYQLSLWGPVSLQPQVRDEAERLFTGFELTPPGQ